MNENKVVLPDVVLDSAHFVMERAQMVHINDAALQSLVEPLLAHHHRGAPQLEEAFGTAGSLEHDINLLFFETAANFCFWSQDEAQKWKVQSGEHEQGGWYGLSAAFYRAIQEGLPLYNSQFMASLSLEQAAHVFRGVRGARIPLLEQRVNNIVEVARFLQSSYGGSALAFVAKYQFSAPAIAAALVQHLPSYRDGAWYAGRWIWVLKRAQIFPSDLKQLTLRYPSFRIQQSEELTVFADYRLPQVLRHYGTLEYVNDLAVIVDQRLLLPSQSPAEIEIRAATIIACERLKMLCGLSSSEVDLALWLLSQEIRDNPGIQPHHLTVSTWY